MWSPRHLSKLCILAKQSWRPKKAGDTLRDVDLGGSADKLADRVAEVKGDKVGDTLTDVKSASLL